MSEPDYAELYARYMADQKNALPGDIPPDAPVDPGTPVGGLVRETVNSAGERVIRYANECGVTIKEVPLNRPDPQYTSNLAELIALANEQNLLTYDIRKALDGR